MSHEHGFGVRSLSAAAAMVALIVVIGMADAVPVALAAFPGRNGQIAFQDLEGTQPSTGVSGANGLFAARLHGPHGHVSIAAHCTTGSSADGDLAGCEPAYSPDGKTIAYDASTYACCSPNEFVVTPRLGLTDAGSNRTFLLPALPEQTNPRFAALEPTFSPDGKRLLFALDGNLFTERTDGSGLRQIPLPTLHGAGATSPAWSTRGLIAFVYRKNIYLIHGSGGGMRRLTHEGGLDPDFSPNGTMIAFTHRYFSRPVLYNQGASVLIVGVDGRGLHPLKGTRGGLCPCVEPAWSPDGQAIAFTTDPLGFGGGANAIYAVRTNGSSRRLIAQVGGYGSLGGATWQPLPAP